MSNSSGAVSRLLADNFEKCDQCGEIVLIHGRGECLELDDAVYCPRHARGRIDDPDWERRWGNAMGLLETIRNDPTKAIKYHMAQGIGDRWVVHREDYIYEKWSRCDSDESNFTTTSESSVVGDIERRALVGSYVGYAPHIVDIDDEPINATVESKRKVMTDGGTPQSKTGDRTPRIPEEWEEGEEPWKDDELMLYLYDEEDYTFQQLGDLFGTTGGNISNWMKKHRADELREGLDIEIPDDRPYDDEEVLRTLYLEEGMSQADIAAVLDCATGTVVKYLGQHGIEARSIGEGISMARGGSTDLYYYTRTGSGYELIKSGDKIVQAHRLQAVAYWGFDALKDKVVHHKKEIPWLNTEDNLQLMSMEQHQDHHKGKMTWLDRLRAAEMYREGASSYDLAPMFDVTPSTAVENVRRVDSELIRNSRGAA